MLKYIVMFDYLSYTTFIDYLSLVT